MRGRTRCSPGILGYLRGRAAAAPRENIEIITQNWNGFCARKQVRPKKQGLHPEMERFLCPKTGEDQRSSHWLRTFFVSEHTHFRSKQTYSACQCQNGRG